MASMTAHMGQVPESFKTNVDRLRIFCSGSCRACFPDAGGGLGTARRTVARPVARWHVPALTLPSGGGFVRIKTAERVVGHPDER